jgi:hypothetical protein
MRSYRNPFRIRAAEQTGEAITFLRNFSPGALEFVPEAIWDRPFVLRSAPGGGKTSLMRLFTVQSLFAANAHRSEFSPLVYELERLGALGATAPTHLGVLLNLNRDYQSLLDLNLDHEVRIRLFFRLLDARILLSVMRAALWMVGSSDPAEIELVPLEGLADAELAASALGGLDGKTLWETAQASEREVLAPLDALLPASVEIAGGLASPELHSLRLLSHTRLQVGETEIAQRPLVMLDDGHALASEQREALLNRLADRTLQVARWYSERIEALSNEELLRDSTEGRDFVELQIEPRTGERRGRKLEKVLRDVSNRRASVALEDYANVQQRFSDLIKVSDEELLGGREGEILSTLRSRVSELAKGRQRYELWLESVAADTGYEAAVGLRALEILISADLEHQQGDLFDPPLDLEELERRKTRIQAVAPHFLAREFELPFYVGPKKFAQLASYNMDQYLRLAGDLFDLMLAEVTLRRSPHLSAVDQEKIARRASERYWREAPARVEHGTLVRRFAQAILTLAQAETFRDTAPYAPGVTGVAMLMSDREKLLEPETRAEIEGADKLFRAIGAGVAKNIFSVELDYAVKNQRVMVIYLNRLFCPRFGLPLGRGGFRERRLETMASWMTGDQQDVEQELEIHDDAQLTL